MVSAATAGCSHAYARSGRTTDRRCHDLLLPCCFPFGRRGVLGCAGGTLPPLRRKPRQRPGRQLPHPPDRSGSMSGRTPAVNRREIYLLRMDPATGTLHRAAARGRGVQPLVPRPAPESALPICGERNRYDCRKAGGRRQRVCDRRAAGKLTLLNQQSAGGAGPLSPCLGAQRQGLCSSPITAAAASPPCRLEKTAGWPRRRPSFNTRERAQTPNDKLRLMPTAPSLTPPADSC